MIFGDENGDDTRCKLCGSFLYSVVRDGAFIHIAMGCSSTIRPYARPSTSSSAPRRAVVH